MWARKMTMPSSEPSPDRSSSLNIATSSTTCTASSVVVSLPGQPTWEEQAGSRFVSPVCFVIRNRRSHWDRWFVREVKIACDPTLDTRYDETEFRGESLFACVHSSLKYASLVTCLMDAVSLNCAYEIGVAHALGKPVVLMLPLGGTVDVQRYYNDSDGSRPLLNPPIDIDRDFSDVKGVVRVNIDMDDPDAVRQALHEQFTKTGPGLESISSSILRCWCATIDENLGHMEDGVKAHGIASSVKRLQLGTPLLEQNEHRALVEHIGNAMRSRSS